MTERLTAAAAEAEARRIIAEAYRQDVPAAVAYRDTTPPTPTGAEPVQQPETRIVPAWAVGTAVASIGLGAGSVGLGCAVWLAAQGLASISLAGVLAALAPFVGVALVVVVVGAVLGRVAAASSTTTNVYNGPVSQNTTNVQTHARGLARTRTEVQR